MTDEDDYELDLNLEEDDDGPSRPLRFLPEGRWLVETTTRTIHGRYLLLPSPGANTIIRGVLARANFVVSNVKIVSFWFLSNHFNLLLEVPNSAALSKFMNHVNSELARRLGRLYDWPDKFWSRRYRAIVIVGARAQVRRLKYLLAQGTKENLVARPCDWPGVSSLRAVTEGAREFGVWFDASAAYIAGKRGKRVRRSDFETTFEILVHPLPCWSHLPSEEQRTQARELVRQIEEEARQKRAESGRKPLGAEKILRQDPQFRPEKVAKSPAPLVHALSRGEKNWFFDRYYRFSRRYRAAAERFLGGGANAINDFPPRCFLPRPPVGIRYQTEPAATG